MSLQTRLTAFVNSVGTDIKSIRSSMMDLTSNQVPTGIKTFPPGTLLMRASDGTTTAEPYSDVNPPSTFERTIQGTTPANPPAGEAVEWTTDGKSLDMKAPDGTVTRIGPSAGGGGGGSGTELAATTDYTSTTPAAPTTGVKIFARHNARRLPSAIGPLGLDTALQPALFSNRVARLNAINASTSLSTDGIVLTHLHAGAATPISQTITTANFYAAMVRYRTSTTATAGIGAGTRSTSAQWFTSSTANMGGFFAVFRCGLGVITATQRAFVGLSATTTALSPTVNPSTLLNLIGFGFDSAQTTWRVMYNDATGAATTVDLGANFPVRGATDFYEFRLFSPSGGGNLIYWSAKRLNDGAFVQGGPVTTDIPAVGTLLAAHFHISNGTTAAAASLDIQSLYVETDN